jgi:hypothetical protein
LDDPEQGTNRDKVVGLGVGEYGLEDTVDGIGEVDKPLFGSVIDLTPKPSGSKYSPSFLN